MRLTDQHIDFISNNLELYGLKNKDLKEDILDHICTHIEKAEDDDFDKAYRTAIYAFGGYSNINLIQTETNVQLYFKSVKNLNRLLFTIQLLTSMLIVTGSLFKIMRWSHAGWIIFLGFVLLIVLALPLYFYSKYKEKLLKNQS